MRGFGGIYFIDYLYPLPAGFNCAGFVLFLSGCLTSTPFQSARVVDPGFFELLGLTVLEGRSFGKRDGADAEPVVVEFGDDGTGVEVDDDTLRLTSDGVVVIEAEAQ